MLGVLAAQQGRREEADRIAAQLRGMRRPELYGEPTLWRARIAAQLGEKARAVALLRDAMAEGSRALLVTMPTLIWSRSAISPDSATWSHRGTEMTTNFAGIADRYRIEHELGAGGMATVYLAHDLRHERKVAIKVLRPELAALLGRGRFLTEIRLTARLDHPHIVDPDRLRGVRRRALVRAAVHPRRVAARPPPARKQLPLDEALAITRQIAGALDYAHGQGVIHRDLKPENILLHQGEAMLADFGIALALQEAGGQPAHRDRPLARDAALHEPGAGRPATARSTPGATCTRSAPCSTRCSRASRRTPARPPNGIAKLMTERPTRLRHTGHGAGRGGGRGRSRSRQDTVRPVRDRRRAHQGPGGAIRSRPTSDHPPAPHRNRGGRSGLRRSRGRVCLGTRPSGGTVRGGADPPRGAPFESIGDSSDPTFGDGMSEAILERLARVPRLSLMGRRASSAIAPPVGRPSSLRIRSASSTC